MDDEVKEHAQVEATEEDEKKEGGQELKVPEKPLEKMTVKELREIALKIPGVAGVSAMKKDEVLSVVKEYRGIEETEPSKKKKVKKARGELTVKDLKAKLVLLRQEKEAARDTRDRKKIDVLRRRINRLKKQTRRVVQA